MKYPQASQELAQMDYDLRLLRGTTLNLILFSTVYIFYGFIAVFVALFFSALITGYAWFRRRNRICKRRYALYSAAIDQE